MADYSKVSFKNNGKLKLLIIVGTRPEIIRLAAVITKCRKYFDTIPRSGIGRSGGVHERRGRRSGRDHGQHHR